MESAYTTQSTATSQSNLDPHEYCLLKLLENEVSFRRYHGQMIQGHSAYVARHSQRLSHVMSHQVVYD